MNSSNMVISREIKAKVFAPYIGQKIVNDKGRVERLVGITILGKDIFRTLVAAMSVSKSVAEITMILRPLSEITEEDAIEFAFLAAKPHVKKESTDKIPSAEAVKKFISETIMCMVNPYYVECGLSVLEVLNLYQFLQSRGYDLPHYLLGGKTLKETGLAIYEPVKAEEQRT